MIALAGLLVGITALCFARQMRLHRDIERLEAEIRTRRGKPALRLLQGGRD